MSYDLPWANASNSPFRRYKSWVHEGGISTPLIVHWPRGIENAGIRTSPIHLIDILPTLADVAGIPVPNQRNGIQVHPVEGESFVSSFNRNDWQRSRPLWFEHEGNRAIRDESWKLVSRHPGKWELYNIDDDRTETNDLADNEPTRVKQMARDWEATANRVGVKPELSRIWDGVATWHAQSAESLRSENSF